MVKRIKPPVHAYCTYCKAEGKEKVQAHWRISYDFSQRACDEHKPALEAYEQERRRIDGEYSEADYQTWMRL